MGSRGATFGTGQVADAVIKGLVGQGRSAIANCLGGEGAISTHQHCGRFPFAGWSNFNA